jgi:hypothetical protein
MFQRPRHLVEVDGLGAVPVEKTVLGRESRDRLDALAPSNKPI